MQRPVSAMPHAAARSDTICHGDPWRLFMCGNPARSRLATNAPSDSTTPRTRDFCRSRKMVKRGYTAPTTVDAKALPRDQFHLFQRLGVGSAQNAAFGDDCRDVPGWRHIEGRIADAD